MLKKLRLKIILAIVLVAAVMLGAILGLFYTLTKQNLRTQSISMMQAIAADPFSPVQPGQEPQQVHLPYFVLQTDAFGNLVAIGSSDYDLTDRAFCGWSPPRRRLHRTPSVKFRNTACATAA